MWVIPIQFFYALVLMLLIWYVAEHTPLGVRALFVGKSRDVAAAQRHQLRPHQVGRVHRCRRARRRSPRWSSSATRCSMSPTSFSPYLLPAYAAVFLGATTIHPGRFNPLGTAIAVLFLATGISGLQIIGAQDYAQYMFYGGTLIVAVAGSRYLRGR